MTTQTFFSMRNTSDNSPTSPIKMVSLFLLMFVSCFLAAMLFSYDVNDPAWVNSGMTSASNYQNIGGALGAWISDILLTGLGYAAFLLPLAGIYLSFRLWRETPVDVETLTFRLLALVCGMLGFSVLATVHLSSPINSVAITGGGMMGQFFVTKLIHLFSPTILLFAAFLLVTCCFMLFFNTGPLTIVDGIGNLILGKKALTEEKNVRDSESNNAKVGWFKKKQKATSENSDALQAKLRAISDIDNAANSATEIDDTEEILVNPAVAKRKESIADLASNLYEDEPLETHQPMATQSNSTHSAHSEPTNQLVKKSTPTITPPHYEKMAANTRTDTRQSGVKNVEPSLAEEVPSRLNTSKNVAKQAIGDLTSLLHSGLLKRKKQLEPILTSDDHTSLPLEIDRSSEDEHKGREPNLVQETAPAKREPSLFSKTFAKRKPQNVQEQTSETQVSSISDAKQHDQENFDQINADIRAHRKAQIHQDNSAKAQAYRQENAYARDENPAERFSQPAAPMQSTKNDYDQPIRSTAPMRKPVNPEIQQKIVSDILEDNARQAKLRQAPLQPKKQIHAEPFEQEVAKTVSSIPARPPIEPILEKVTEPTLVTKPTLNMPPNNLNADLDVVETDAETQPEQHDSTIETSFVEQLNAQIQTPIKSATTIAQAPTKSSMPSHKRQGSTAFEDTVQATNDHRAIEPTDKIQEQVQTPQQSTPPPVQSSIAQSAQFEDSSNNAQTNLSQNVKVNIGQAYEATQKASQMPMSNVTHHELPSIDLLDNAPPLNAAYTEDDLRDMAEVLETTLKEFKLDVTVMNISPGPVITRFEMDLAPGVQASKISRLSNDLARALAVSSVRVEEVIAGSSYIGLEVPNMNRQTVYLKDIFKSKAFQSSKSVLTLALGTDISGQPIVADLKKMPHLLVAGTTGSGKSVSINTMLLSMLYKATPRDLRLIMVDPKMLEMSMYEDIPHLLTPVITDMEDAENALTWAVAEMERRYKLMAAMKIRKIESFNEIIDNAEANGETVKDPLWQPNEAVGYTHHPSLERLPYIVIVIDELADMMMVVGKQVEQLIARLTQKARAAGIHLIIATQRPSTDVLTGLIKANVPTRIAFQVSSGTDSKVIIDTVGAQNLLGNGDMLYVPAGSSHPNRLHGAFVNDQETDRITDFIRSTGEPDYINSITNKQSPEDLGAFGAADVEKSDSDDPLYGEAVEIVLTTGKASISSVQRQLRIGYNRAARMIEQMQADGIVSEPQNGIRKVLKGH